MLPKRADKVLEQDVERELRWDSRTIGSPIHITVDHGVVSLAGNVSCYAKKIAAQRAAHHVAGVLDVVNNIEVEPSGKFQRTDAQIAGAVRETLEWDALIPGDEITSTVSGGWVTLEGTVAFPRQCQDAERALRRLKGVVGVINKIVVNHRPPSDPKQLRLHIEQALERRGDREAARLRIEIKNGAVDLHGRVHSWEEKCAVLGAISHAPGVKQVVDDLRIDPYF